MKDKFRAAAAGAGDFIQEENTRVDGVTSHLLAPST